MSHMHTLSRSSIEALIECRIIGKEVTLPQLDRTTYENVNEAFVIAGGEWNRGMGCHIFKTDPNHIINRMLDDGGIVDTKKMYQQFFTPREVALKTVEFADVVSLAVLEPSAGQGSLVDACEAMGASRVDCVEIDPANVEILRRQGRSNPIREGNFLSMRLPERYARIVMNPPFHNGDDIKHIRHALTHLKVGGRLVSILANGPRQRAAFMDEATHWEDLPAGAFKESGTMVNSAILVIDK